MTATTARAVVLSLSALWCVGRMYAAGQQAVFRSGVDVVSVDVSVLRGHMPVTGLVSGDFSLIDNGVSQDVAAVEAAALPLDVTVVLDESGSVGTPRIRQSAGAARQIAGLLHPVDRLRVVAFATDVQEVIPLAPATPDLAIVPISVDGATSLDDAVVYTLLTARPARDRRHLTVIFTDGFENSSVLGADMLESVARRADTLIHVVVPTTTVTAMSLVSGEVVYRNALLDVAVMSGGEPHELSQQVGIGGGPTSAADRDQRVEAALVASFRRILEDFRQSYVLQYTVHGVPREGWHDIVVTVHGPGADKYTVRARQGYFGG